MPKRSQNKNICGIFQYLTLEKKNKTSTPNVQFLFVISIEINIYIMKIIIHFKSRANSCLILGLFRYSLYEVA